MNLDKDTKRELLLSLLAKQKPENKKIREADIAIIGVSGRYPQSPTLTDFWKNLCEGRSCVAEVPQERWDWKNYSSQDDQDYSLRRAGFITDVDKFDPLFFGISPREAERMDPQERLFLQCAWHTLEDAGYTPEGLSSSEQQVGVFAGVMNSNYSILGSRIWEENRLNSKAFACNPVFWSIANRVSFTLNFTGPSFAVDSACSSSLTAIHLACESLRRGECDLALAGGVNLILHPAQLASLSKMNMLSKKGNCFSFGAESDGFTDGEGVGSVLLKPLAQAIADHDNIYAIIKGSALNSGGKTSAFTVPNPNAQAALIERAIKNSGVNPRAISYIEAHGTGTQLGDPIEIRGLSKAFSKFTQDKQFCAIGSVKANIGHLESAAGISALTKVILQLKHRKLVPSILAEELNPNIDFSASPFYLQQNLTDWDLSAKNPVRTLEDNNSSKYAGISSFGAGGANAHLILESYTAPLAVEQADHRPHLIYLSAQSHDQLGAYAQSLSLFLQEDLTKEKTQQVSLRNLAYTLAVGRVSLESRLAIVVHSTSELKTKLDEYLNDKNYLKNSLSDSSDEKLGQLTNNHGIFFGEVEANGTVEVTNIASINLDILHTLASQWVSGAIDKSTTLPQGVKAKRISLPSYPFKKESYWINLEKTNSLHSDAISEAIPLSNESKNGLIYLSSEWTQRPLAPIALPQDDASLMIFCEPTVKTEIELCGAFAGRDILWVTPGNTNERLEKHHCCISSQTRESFFSGMDKLCDKESKPLNILIATRIADQTDQRSLIKHLLFISQYLVETKRDGQSALFVWNADTGAARNIAACATAGFLKSLRVERPALKAKHISFSASVINYSLAEQCRLISAEFQQSRMEKSPDTGMVIRYQRNSAESGNGVMDERYVESIGLQKQVSLGTKTNRLSSGATYLITGGAGGIGRIIAKELVRREKVNIVLTGRSQLDDEKRQLIKELQLSGNEVIYIPCDVTNRIDANHLIEKINNRFGKLNGIIHSAGVLNDCLLQRKNWEMFQSVVDAKVEAIINLDEATADQNLDFFVAFSSITSMLGNMGQTDYAYGNSFLDYFIQDRNLRVAQGQRQGRSFSINWPIWEAGGMHIAPAILKAMEETIGVIPLSTGLGVESFFDILQSDIDQVAPVYGKTSRIVNYLNNIGLANIPLDTLGESIAKKVSVDSSNALEEKKSLTTNSVDAGTRTKLLAALTGCLRELISETLEVPLSRINNDRVLVDYGFDSITIQELASRIKQVLTLSVSPGIFFSSNTVSKIAHYLIENYPSELSVVLNIHQEQMSDSVQDLSSSNFSQVNKMVDSRHNLSANRETDVCDIAIIGMDGIFPGANNLDEFWKNLQEGVDVISEIPADRWRWQDHYGDSFGTTNKTNSKWGGFINDVDKFDYEFFELSKQEANFMDPQQRLFLQSAWNAIEGSGYNPLALGGKSVGVFVGVEFSDYKDLLDSYGHYHAEMAVGNAHNMIPNRVSYFLDLHGPSEAIDTACSSSLVAINRAVRSLQSGESSLAIAGGVSLTLSPKTMIGTSQLNIYSPDGRCKTLDQNANGYVKGEGVGVVILKPLSDALADKDKIIAVIKSCVVNHGGRSNSITAPNPEAQAQLLFKAYRDAKVTPDRIKYIEMHGTGTRLGDPVEVEGIKGALRKLSNESGRTANAGSCGLGSVKTNIGHLEPAAGIAGLLKVLLSLQHKQLPANLHFDVLNPLIHLDDSPLYVVNKLAPLLNEISPTGELVPVIAGVSSFGFGGSNAHIVIEQWLESSEQKIPTRPQAQVIPLSAKTMLQLHEQANNLLAKLNSPGAKNSISSENTLEEIAFTLQTGRQAMTHRLALVVGSLDELKEKLADFLAGKNSEGIHLGEEGESKSFEDLLNADFRAYLLQKAEPDTLARWWVKGLDLDWSELYLDGHPARVALPTYPFNKQSCWIPATPGSAIASQNSVINGNINNSTGFISTNSPTEKTTVACADKNHPDADALSQVSSKAIISGKAKTDDAADRVMVKLAEVSGKALATIEPGHNLALDLGLDSIKMIGLINGLVAESSSDRITEFNKLGMNSIINKARDVKGLVAIFSGQEITAKEELKTFENLAVNKKNATLLDAQMVFLPAYFLTKSSSLCSYLEITGEFDLGTANRAWRKLIERHPSLQMKFGWPNLGHPTLGGVTAEFVDDFSQIVMPSFDISDLDSAQKNQYVADYFHERLNASWKLDVWPLHEISVICKSKTSWVLFWSNEHIISDGLSNQMALREFLEIYSCLMNGQAMPKIALSDRDEYLRVVDHINNYSSNETENADLSRFADTNNQYLFNPGNSVRNIQRARFSNLKRLLSTEKTQSILNLSQASRFSINSLLTSAFVRSVTKFDQGASNIILQIPTSGRTYPKVDVTTAIGCFAQNLSLDIQTDSSRCQDLSLIEQIQEQLDEKLISAQDLIQTHAMRAMISSIPLDAQHQLTDFSSGMLLASVKSNLYFPFTGETGIAPNYSDLHIHAYTAGTSNAPGTIDFLQEIHGGQLHVFVNYDESYFSAALMESFVETYLNELDSLLNSDLHRSPKIVNAEMQIPTINITDIQAPESQLNSGKVLSELLQKILHKPIDRNLWESDLESALGLDSLGKIRLINNLHTELGQSINKRKLMQCRTLREMQVVIDANEALGSKQLINQAIRSTLAPDESYSIPADLTAKDLPIRHIIEQCKRTPNAIAVTHVDGQSITYAELDQQSNQVANFLLDKGVKQGDYLGLIVNRGPRMLTAIVAILKCGAAYVPMDPLFPTDRMKYIIRHAKISTLLSESALTHQIADLFNIDGSSADKSNNVNNSIDQDAGEIKEASCILLLDNLGHQARETLDKNSYAIFDQADWSLSNKDLPIVDINPEDDMVVLFTSGSTGNPKGVVLHHVGYANRLMWHQKIFQLQPGEKVAQKTSCSFDVAIWEHLWPLMYGGTVCAVEKDLASNPWELAEWLIREEISIAHFVPSMFAEFVNSLHGESYQFPSLRWLLFSGEALPTACVQSWIDTHGLDTGLCNLYGPTEASIDVSYHFIAERPKNNEAIPIGKAVDNTRLLVRDEQGNILPTGQLGELCIAGVQLAKGYLYEPELTAKAFVANGYSTPDLSVPGLSIYRTGDLALERSDGVFEYHGRQDSQVKLRGFRVELGEIENVATGHKNIDEAAALVLDDQLVLCYSGKLLDDEEIKQHIAEKCPVYMIPQRMVYKEKLPKNANGKLDRKAIKISLQMDSSAGGNGNINSDRVEPLDSTLETLGLNGLIKKSLSENTSAAKSLPVGPAQKWIFSYFDAPYSWWGYSRLPVNAHFDPLIFNKALNHIVGRHDALRTIFVKEQDCVVQKTLQKPASVEIQILHLTQAEDFDEQVMAHIKRTAESILPDVWPLFKVSFIKAADDRYELVWIAHHLVSDLISGYIVNREIWQIYNHFTLSSLEPSLAPVPGYSDYLEDIGRLYAAADPAAVLDFWKRYSLKKKGKIQLPYDHQSGENCEGSSANFCIALPAKTTHYLQVEGREFFDASFYNMLSAVVYQLLALTLRRSWIVVSHKLNGRHLQGSNNNYFESIGNFAINVPVGISINRADSFRDTLGALGHEIENLPLNGTSYDWVSNLLPESSYPDCKLTDIRINYLGDISASLNHDAGPGERLSQESQRRTSMIEFFFYTKNKVTYLDIQYSTNFYKSETIAALAYKYLEQLELLADEIIPEILPTN